MYKHPHRFNRLGASQWSGVIYGEGAVGLPLAAPVIYHGRFGAGLFQSIYTQNRYSSWAVLTLLEWHALAALCALLGAMWHPLLFVAVMMWAATAVAATRTALASPLPRSAPPWCRWTVIGLHILRPIVRAGYRYRHRIQARRLPALGDPGAPGKLRLRPVARFGYDAYWMSHKNRGRAELLAAVEAEAHRLGWQGVFDDVWTQYDILLFGDRWYSAMIRTATEELGWPRCFTRARVRLRVTLASRLCLLTVTLLTIVALATNNIAVAGASGVTAALVMVRMLVGRRRVVHAVADLLERSGDQAGLRLAMEDAQSAPAGVAAELALDTQWESGQPAMR